MSTLKEMPFELEIKTKLEPFWEGLNNGEFKSTKCVDCGSNHFPPRILCPNCYSNNIEWKTFPKKGTVTTYTHVSIPPAGFEGEYKLVSVMMDELDKAILGRLLDAETISIGDRVSLDFEFVKDQALIVFRKE